MNFANSSICLRWSTSSLTACASGRLRDARHRAVGHQAKVDERGQHPRLAAEDCMDGVAGDAGEVRDVLHGGARVAALEEELGRGVEDARVGTSRLLVAHCR